MSTEQIRTIAENDTPAGVKVPEGALGILAWAVGRFGSGIVFAFICMLGMKQVYQDQKELTQQVLVSFNKQADVTAKNSNAIDSLTRAVETLTKDQRNNESLARSIEELKKQLPPVRP